MSARFCEHCGTKLNGRYGMASTYGHVEYQLESKADCAHTETRCREALKERVDVLEKALHELDDDDALQCDGPGHAEEPCNVCPRCRARNLIRGVVS
jgi:hypothetical protein